ncbi:hypothetical protein Ciccas_009927 [Cichlidogyrus casuarinus]|uniref:Uncharacterized protein n=1 Tax=Cichlidogyrus casuarinus TaxID=1844966 RepID=A0ABD2PVL6_9PLAT
MKQAPARPKDQQESTSNGPPQLVISSSSPSSNSWNTTTSSQRPAVASDTQLTRRRYEYETNSLSKRTRRIVPNPEPSSSHSNSSSGYISRFRVPVASINYSTPILSRTGSDSVLSEELTTSSDSNYDNGPSSSSSVSDMSVNIRAHRVIQVRNRKSRYDNVPDEESPEEERLTLDDGNGIGRPGNGVTVSCTVN